MTALATVEDYIDDARVLLQDEVAPYRYDDTSMLTALNVTLLETRRLRPDLFLSFTTNIAEDSIPQFTTVNTDAVEIEAQFRLGVLHGLVAHALERDQEDIQDDRSTQFMNVFNAIMIGRATPGLARPRRG